MKDFLNFFDSDHDGERRLPKVLAVVVSDEDARKTIASLEAQTLRPGIVLANKRFGSKRGGGVNIAKAINFAIEQVDLSKFDWFLRVDGDIALPPHWIEKSMECRADVVGKSGNALLIRMPAFIAVGARFPSEIDFEDTAMLYKLEEAGFKRVSKVVGYYYLRKTGQNYDFKHFVTFGDTMWAIGYDPAHAIYNAIYKLVTRRDSRYLIGIPYYFSAALSGKKRWSVREHFLA